MTEYGPHAVGTEKRERQKQARQEKIEQLRHVEQRRSVRRRGGLIAAAIVAFVAFAIAFSVITKDDGGDAVAAGDASTTTAVGNGSTEPSTTDTGDSSTTATTEAATPIPCPPVDGSAERTTEFPAPPPECIDPSTDYHATVVTDAGTIEVDLLEDKAPMTVNNFVYLARYHFFDGLTFHRVIPDFVLQGGDPLGNGTGGPGYSFPDELPDPGDYQAGSLAMANSGPDSNGSQFFIVTSEAGAKSLVDAVGGDAAYSLFGQVTDGMDVVKAIESDGSPSGQPSTVHTIESVTITES